MKLPLQLRFIIIILITALLCCSPQKMAGNTSESGNPTISGAIYSAHGQSAAINALVIIRAKHSIAGYNSNTLQNIAIPESTFTDKHGYFGFDSDIAPGMYVIEATLDKKAALIDSIIVNSNDSTVNLAPDTLEETGVIRGTIRLTEGYDPQKVFISAYGFDRYASVAADGSFSFENLPGGNYHLLIWSEYDDFGVIDTQNIEVLPSHTTETGLQALPYEGIATIGQPSASYDTLLQQVSLGWQRPQTGIAASFNVYRRSLDTANAVFTRLNAFALTGTQFTDTACEQDNTFEYCITALDMDMNEGKKSESVIIKIDLYNIVPFNVNADYDTVKQSITLHWECEDREDITGFNVYRINMDPGESFGSPLNNNPITENTFTDSLFALDSRDGTSDSGSIKQEEPAFAYCVRAIIRNERVGTMSDTVIVQVDLGKITPSELTAVSDSGYNYVRLHWNIADTTLIKGFAVYRKCTSTNEQQLTQLSSVPVSQRNYTDSTGIAFQTYEYCIGSLLRDNRSVIRSANAKLTIASQ